MNHYIVHLEQIIMHSNYTSINFFYQKENQNQKENKIKLMVLVPRHLKLTKPTVKWNDHHSLSNINIPDSDKPC